MERSDAKYLFSVPEFFRSELDNNGTYLEDVDPGDDEKNCERIGHHRHDPEIGAECQGAHITHIEFGGLDIEPQKCDECPDDEHADSREDKKAVGVGYKGVYDIVEEEESTREPIEPIGHIHRIRHGDDDEYEEGDVENPETYLSEKREMESGVPKFYIEPIGPKTCKYRQKHHFYPSRESLGTSDSSDIQVVVHETDESDGREREEGKIGLIPIPETVFYLDTQYILYFRGEKVNDHRNGNERENRDKDDSGAHGWGPGLVFMELRKLRSLSDEGLFANLFPKLVSMEETDVWRNENESEKEGKEEIDEEKC